jgi:mannosyltransferase OCH1-like enzyme
LHQEIKSKMIPKILHQSAYKLSWEENQLTKRAKKIMPDWEYKFWNDADNEQLFAECFPKFIDTYRKMPANVIRADLARCAYLYKFGGIYFDTDYKFFRQPTPALMQSKCALGIEDYQTPDIGGYKYGNALMASEPGFELWPAVIENASKLLSKGVNDIVFLAGPHALTLLLRDRPDILNKISVFSLEQIYPHFKTYKLTGFRDMDTLGVHLCWGSWREKSLIQRAKNRGRRILSSVWPS